ncbi:MAG: biotin/acetyl-CoA-carboxylase ligase [Bacteroidota bacterium]|jgi:BirA family biotin operon repressor/biotin-[acetyl-CoA-carboxylase] ligase|nr:biotin/acetyl-CoA-carboxylase ligase [Bacteroidota bacterium]
MKTLFTGQHAVHLTAVDSTNSYASEMLRQMRPSEGTIIYTFEQTQGRGQRGNTWYSEPNKNIALSLILHPSFLKISEQFLLTKMVSLAVSDLMAELLPEQRSEVKIKWPNDIYVASRKIAGILIENTLVSQHIQSSVIGIGMNVNQTEFSVESGKPVSLKMHSGQEYDLKLIIDRLCEFIEARYLQLKARKMEGLDHTYLQRLYQINEWKSYTSGDEEFEGRILSVSNEGKLQVELQSGDVKGFDLKEIGLR